MNRSGYQLDSTGTASYQPDTTTDTPTPRRAKLPPPDGALSTCRRCNNEVRYNAGRGRWEHPGHGHWECFQPGGYE